MKPDFTEDFNVSPDSKNPELSYLGIIAIDLPPIRPASYNSAMLFLENFKSPLILKVTITDLEFFDKSIELTLPTLRPFTVIEVPP